MVGPILILVFAEKKVLKKINLFCPTTGFESIECNNFFAPKQVFHEFFCPKTGFPQKFFFAPKQVLHERKFLRHGTVVGAFKLDVKTVYDAPGIILFSLFYFSGVFYL